MSDNTYKAIVINSKRTQPGRTDSNWNSVEYINDFIKGIEIPMLDGHNNGMLEADLGALVSGVPTIFARAVLFRNALDNAPVKGEVPRGLMLFYKVLINEWRGLISCIALNYKDVEIDRIELKYSDGLSFLATANIYEPLGAFGNLLFERKPLWCEPTIANNQAKIPFIDVISLKGEAIGATSPDCFLFTSVSYKNVDKYPFVNSSGKFTDPLGGELQPEQLMVLYAYVAHIIGKIHDFKKYYTGLEEALIPDYQSVSKNLEEWLEEMILYAEKRDWPKLSNKTASPPEINAFKPPFSILFNHSTELYGVNGVIYAEENQNTVTFNPKELLLPETTEILMFRVSSEQEKNKDFQATHPLLLLRADREDNPNLYAYFTLPLTPLALRVFGNNLDALLGIKEDSPVKSRLSAVYTADKNKEKLIVKLRLYTQNGTEILKEIKYKVGGEIKGKDILLWPNFMSKNWNRYFMYNEIPHNDTQYQATPFIGDVKGDDFKILLNEKKEPLCLASNGKIIELNVDKTGDNKASLQIEHNMKVSDNNYRYEIYESNQPFKGLKFSKGKSDNLCGYVIIRYTKNISLEKLPRDRTAENDENLADAKLGIDFGSTNSSIAYWSDKSDINNVVEKITLKNRRISLLAVENNKNDDRPASENEIFFFQNDEIKTNSIKSVLALHDYKRIANNSNKPLEREVTGGFPCFEKNLPIENSDNSKLTLNFNRAGVTELKYNMKWSSNPDDKSCRLAYLKSLMLHIYAQLFEDGHQPVSIKWSYPGSMRVSKLREYQGIYESIRDICPLVHSKTLFIFQPSELNTNLTSNDGQSIASIGQPENQLGSEFSSSIESNSSDKQKLSLDENESNIHNASNLIRTEEKPLRMKFRILKDDESLSESCAVANYFLQKIKLSQEELLIIFDVGGSTTDISVLAQLPVAPDSQLSGKAMIKQNSIRWAAQRLSVATSYSKNFQSVLLRMCDRKKIKIAGLNLGENKYNSNTAPFYYEQLIDRLEDSDFPDFYKLIATECKELMSINIYITGLIIYYAGQLTLKIRQEMLRSEDVPEGIKNSPPRINIAFAGKGARMFDWLEAVNPKASKDYYTQMFILGVGGIEKAKSIITPFMDGEYIKLNAFKVENNADVKYEVSKGLAIPAFKTNILVPDEKKALEILGEDGFCVSTSNGEKKYLDFSNSVTPEMMESLGTYFVSSPEQGKPPCPRFMEFANLFYLASNKLFDFRMKKEEIRDGFYNMNIETFIRQDPDYIEAQKRKVDGEKFDYVAPVLLMEGIKFFEERILKSIRDQR